MKTKLLLWIILMAGGKLLYPQSIERQVIACSGNDYESAGLSISWTLGETAIETFGSGNVIITQGFQQPTIVIRLFIDLKVFLEGPYNSVADQMETSLNTLGYLPLQQPYNPALPYYNEDEPVWFYEGNESVPGLPPGAVDWVVVQLRDADQPLNATSDKTIGTMAAFVNADGSVTDTEGSNLLEFDAGYSQNLYVVVFHRNHLGVISAAALVESGGIYTYDFSSGAGQALGGTNGHKELEPGVWGMVGGDGNGNGLIQNTDETAVWKVDLGQSGYKGGDFNMNGLVQNTDETNYWKINLGTGGQTPAKAGQGGYQSQVPK